MVCKDLTSLFEELQKRIDKTLEKEVATYIKEEISKSVDLEVYSKYMPRKYKRRGAYKKTQRILSNPKGTGSIADPKMMDSTVEKGVLKITDVADFHSLSKSDTIDKTKSLSENIEYGYGSKNKPFNVKRPFLSKTVERLKKSKKLLIVFKKGLKNKKLNVK